MSEITINAAEGEGGGQIIRTSLALASLLGKKVKLFNIRAKRPKAGLQKQHLTAIKALKTITKAKVSGLYLGSQKISFKPKTINDVSLNINIGTAGSIALLLQQLLPVALKAKLSVRVIGGTHVPFSPSITFMQEVLIPMLKKMNAKFNLALLSYGFYPKGQGRILFESEKSLLPLKSINLTNKGNLKLIKCFSFSSGLPSEVSSNQAIAAKNFLKQNIKQEFELIEEIKASKERKETIGSSIDLIAFHSNNVLIASNALGKKGISAQTIGLNAAKLLIEQLNSNAACDFHLADQLIPFMALAKGSSIIHTTKLTQHCLTNIKITEKFLPVKFQVKGELNKEAEIQVEGIGFQ